jgi:CRISPR-associated protein Cst2
VKSIACHKLDDHTYEVKENDKAVGKIVVCPTLGGSSKIAFKLDPREKTKRAEQLLNTLRDGFYAQSSGESNPLVPLFIIAGAVKIPSPIFHPFIDVAKEDGQWKVIGVGDALNNSWLEKNGSDTIVYIQDCERLRVDSLLKSGKDKWEDFLKNIKLGEDKKEGE